MRANYEYIFSDKTAGNGGFYGGNSGAIYYGSGGGSGYIGNSLLTSKYMYCYNCATSSIASELTYPNQNYSETATANKSKTKNGYARITYLGN